MYISCSLWASAFVLSFSTCVEARMAQHRLDSGLSTELEEKKSENPGFFHGWSMKNILEKRQIQDLNCSTPNVYIDFMDDKQGDEVQTFCNRWLSKAPATTVIEFTPTITVTTTGDSTTTIVSTTRVVTTQTVVQTATITPAPIVRRAVNNAAYAATYAAANRIFRQVVTSGTLTPAPPENTGRVEDETGLSNACSCKNVDPTSTVTSAFTAPAVYKTAGHNNLRLLTITSTKFYTTVVTVAVVPSPTLEPPTLNASTPLASSSSLASSGFSIDLSSASQSSSIINSSLASLGSSSDVSSASQSSSSIISAPITARPSITLILTGSAPPTASPSAGPRVPVVIGLPFSCPGANANNPSFIVGGLRYEYSVLCNKAIITDNNTYTFPSPNETGCAQSCSLLNHESGDRVCEVAMFTAASGAGSGSCLISGPTQNVVDQPGSTAIFLTGISSSDNTSNCGVAQPDQASSNTTAAPTALLASIASSGYSTSIPGLVSRTETGGVSETYYSSGHTDTKGWYHFSWFKIYASSSAWYEIYATSWSKCANIPRTIVEQLPSTNITMSVDDITTIIHGTITMVISGTSTYTYTNGAGATPPTGVPALTTSGAAAFTTGFSTAITSSIGGAGSLPPSPGSAVSGAANSQIMMNVTFAAPTATNAEGSAAFTRSRGSAYSSATGGFGAVPPASAGSGSVVNANSATRLSGTDVLAISGAISTFNSTSSGGALGPAPTFGAAEFTVSGQIFTETSLGGSGSIPPAPTNGSLLGSASFSTSSSTMISNITRGSGSDVAQTISMSSITVASGAAQFTSTGNSSFTLSSGGNGSQSPLPVTMNSTGSLPTAGTEIFSTKGEASVYSALGSFGAAPPASASLAPSLSLNGSLPGSVGTAVFLTASSTSLMAGTGASNAIPPTPVIVPASASLATLSMNASLPAGTGIFSASGTAVITLAAGSSGGFPLPSANASMPTSASITPSASFNSYMPSITGSPTTSLSEEDSGFHVNSFSVGDENSVSSMASGFGAIPPFNVTATAASSLTPFPSANASITPLGTAPVSLGGLNFSLSAATAISLSTGGAGVASPSANLTTTAPASVMPGPSSNSTTTIDSNLPLSDRPRTGGPRNSTAPIGTGTAATAIVSSTTPSIVSVSSTVPVYGGYGPPPVATSSSSFISVTSSSIVGQPSMTAPPVSANSSLPIPNTTEGIFSNDEDDRRRRSRSSALLASTRVPAILANSTQTPVGTGSSSVPAPSVNSNTLVGTASVTALLTVNSSVILPTDSVHSSILVGTASSAVPILSANSSAILPTGSTYSSIVVGTASSAVPILSVNSTGVLPTSAPSSSVPTLSLNASLPVGTAVSALLSPPTNSTKISATGTGILIPSLSVFSSPANSTTFRPTGTASSFVLAPPANFTIPFATYTAKLPGASSDVGLLTVNSTGIIATGTAAVGTAASLGLPTPSANITVPPSLQTLPPSAIPILSLNSSSEACATAASLSIIAHTTVITTVSYETIPVAPSTCLPTASGVPLLSANGTSPIQTTGAGTSALPAPTSPFDLALPGTARYRRSGDIATQEQIDAACSSTENIVYNPNFALGSAEAALGWTILPHDIDVSFRTMAPGQLDLTANSSASVVITAPSGSLTISQALTLCPGRQYRLSSFNKQLGLLKKCTVEYLIGDQSIYTASPQEFFLEKYAFFNAGLTPEDVSKDLGIRAECDGEATTGLVADSGRSMVVEFNGVSVAIAELGV